MSELYRRETSRVMLDWLVRHTPDLDIEMGSNPSRVRFIFTEHEKSMEITVPPLRDMIERVERAMEALAHRLTFCQHCEHRTMACETEIRSVTWTLQQVLGSMKLMEFQELAEDCVYRDKPNLCALVGAVVTITPNTPGRPISLPPSRRVAVG